MSFVKSSRLLQQLINSCSHNCHLFIQQTFEFIGTLLPMISCILCPQHFQWWFLILHAYIYRVLLISFLSLKITVLMNEMENTQVIVIC